MITINEPQIVIPKKNYSFQSLSINKIGSALQAIIIFNIFDENGCVIDAKSLVYEGEAFNTFWSNFNSGKYLYDEMVAKLGLNVQTDSTLELDFISK